MILKIRKAGIVRLFACRFGVHLRHGPSQMAATFFQSVMAWRTTKSVSETVSGTVSERSRRQFWSADISGRQNSRSFPVPIYREGKTRAVFPSRYTGKAKLAQFSRPDILGNQNSHNFLS